MDPNATLRRILEASDKDDFTAACEDLASWLDRGGFNPDMRGAHYMPGMGAAWSLMSPGGMFPRWALVRWASDGSVERAYTLTAEEEAR